MCPPDPKAARPAGARSWRSPRWGTLGPGRERPEPGAALPPAPLVLTVEDIFGVAGPDLVVCVLVDEGSRHRGVTGHHVESTLGQHVKSPLQVLELEIKPRGVPFWSPVRVSAFIQTFSKNLFDQRNPSTNQNPRDPPEFGVSLALPADSAGAPVADGDESPLAVRRQQRRGGADSGVTALGHLFIVTVAIIVRALLAVVGSQELHQVRELEVLSLPLEPSLLWEVVGQNHLLVPEIVQDIAEKETISVDEESSLGVLGQIVGRVSLWGEHFPEQGVRGANQGGVASEVNLAAHVELHHLGEGVQP